MEERMYLDYAAATPVDARVRLAMEPYFSLVFGNPSSVHTEGQVARKAIERARAQVAELVDARPDEIVFTSGVTESINLALRGALAQHGGYCAYVPGEHPAALLAKEQARVLPAFPSDLADIPEDATIVTSLWVNNETGVISPVHALAVLLQKYERAWGRRPLLHADIAQAMVSEFISMRKTPVDLLSFGSAKIYGPKGVGALFVRSGTKLARLWSGGQQEHGLRPGTENVAGIVGFGEACALLVQEREARKVHVTACREAFLHALTKTGVEFRINGAGAGVAHILSITFFGVESEELVMRLDASGIACSSASACKRAGERSEALLALGMSSKEAEETTRFSFGASLTIAQSARAGALTGEVARRILSASL